VTRLLPFFWSRRNPLEQASESEYSQSKNRMLGEQAASSTSGNSRSQTSTLGVSEQRFYEDDLPSHLYDTEAVRWFLENGLEEKLLNNPAIAAAWHDVAAWYHRYGAAPDRTYLRSEYPSLEVGEPTWSRPGLLEMLKNRYRRSHFQAGIRRAAQLAGETDFTPDGLASAKTFLREWLDDDIPEQEASPLVTYTGAELRDLVEEELPWIAYPFAIDAGVRTMFQGLPKAGKTTYLTRLAEAVVLGREFFGHPTIKMPVVYLTETSKQVFAKQAPKSLLWSDDFVAIPYAENYTASWPAFVRGAVDLCKRIGSRLMIVDTAGKFTALEGDSNNSDGYVRAAIRETDRALNEGISVILSKHNRKSEGSINAAASGSAAWSGEADIIVDIRIASELEKNQRRLQASGRLQEGLGEWVVSYDPADDTVSLLGDLHDLRKNATVEAIREVLYNGENCSLKELTQLTGLEKTAIANALNRNGEVFEKVSKGVYRLKQ
jgi:hypothetical protein